MAQAEALARLLRFLSRTGCDNSNFFLFGFSGSTQQPVGLSVPHRIEKAGQFANIAKNLNRHLPRPEFGDTYLGPALEHAISLLQKSALGHTLFIVITDGQTSDPTVTAKLLIEHSKRLTEAGKNLDIFVVGAGSIFTTHVRKRFIL